jgi:hypothetical protein
MKAAVVLHSSLPPYVVADTLRRSIDEERITLFSLSGYKGSRPVLGKVDESTFRLQKRRYYHNSFAPIFYGRFEPETGGTRIEGYFDMAQWVKYFMWFWLAMVILIGGQIFLASLKDIVTGSHYIHGDKRIGILIPPFMILFGVLLPKVGELLARGEKTFILEHLQQTLVARMEPGNPVSTQS